MNLRREHGYERRTNIAMKNAHFLYKLSIINMVGMLIVAVQNK
jgi:hypothetical protein